MTDNYVYRVDYSLSLLARSSFFGYTPEVGLWTPTIATNFGAAFCLAGDVISRKCNVPHLYRLELFGTPEDIDRVSDGLERWWTQH